MKALSEGRIGVVPVRIDTETWKNNNTIQSFVLNKPIQYKTCDTTVLSDFGIHNVDLGTIDRNGKHTNLSFDDAFNMYSEEDRDGKKYAHIGILREDSDELYICGFEKHENTIDGEKITWYYQWFEDDISETNSAFCINTKNKRGEDVLILIHVEDSQFDDTTSETCELTKITSEGTYLLEYESGIGAYTEFVVFNIKKKFSTYCICDGEEPSFNTIDGGKYIVIHDDGRDVIINTNTGTSKTKNID